MIANRADFWLFDRNAISRPRQHCFRIRYYVLGLNDSDCVTNGQVEIGNQLEIVKQHAADGSAANADWCDFAGRNDRTGMTDSKNDFDKLRFGALSFKLKDSLPPGPIVTDAECFLNGDT